jgi:cation transport ATPase
MSDKASEFREKLFSAQPMSPALRASYEEELERMTNPKLTTHSVVIGVILLVILLAFGVGNVRSMLVYKWDLLSLGGAVILTAALFYSAYLIIRSLWEGKRSPKAENSIAQSLTGAAGCITVVALLIGLQKPSDPASTFNALYVFTFYVACLAWSLERRIANAELAAREQSLRIEFRLADIAERLKG